MNKLPAIATAQFIGLMAVYTVPLQIGVFMDQRGFDQASAGLLGAIELAALSLVTMLLGLVVARLPLARLAVFGLAVSISAQLATLLLDEIIYLGMARFMVGLGCGCLLAAVTAIIALSEDPDRLYGRAFALSTLLFGAWLLVLPRGASYLGRDGFFVMLALLNLLALPLVRRLPRVEAGQQIRPTTERPHCQGILLLILAITVVYMTYGGIYYFSERIAASIGIPIERIVLAYALSALTGCAGAAFAGWCLGRFRRTPSLVSAFLVMGLIGVGIVIARQHIFYLGLIVVLNGVLMFSITSVLAAAAALDSQGRVATLAEGYIVLAMSMGTALSGFLVASTGFASLALPALAMCCAGAVFIVPLGRRLDKREPGPGSSPYIGVSDT